MEKKLEDISLDYLDIRYKTADRKINPSFDKAVRELAKLYGLKFFGSGVYLITRERDIYFERR